MNGATAELDDRTMSVPRRTRQTMMGRSQNFFRSFMNNHNSLTSSLIARTSSASELMLHMRCRPGLARYAVSLQPGIEPPPHRVSSEESHQDCRRRKQQNVCYTKKHLGIQVPKGPAECHPPAIEAVQEKWEENSGEKK
jgi:hypothetical protein